MIRTTTGGGPRSDAFTAFFCPKPCVYSQTLWLMALQFFSLKRQGFPISLNPGWSWDLLGPIECHGNDEMSVLGLSLKEPCPLVLLVSITAENVLGLF